MKEPKYEFADFIGTLEECMKFYEEHKADCIAPPYLYARDQYRVCYWRLV